MCSRGHPRAPPQERRAPAPRPSRPPLFPIVPRNLSVHRAFCPLVVFPTAGWRPEERTNLAVAASSTPGDKMPGAKERAPGFRSKYSFGEPATASTFARRAPRMGMGKRPGRARSLLARGHGQDRGVVAVDDAGEDHIAEVVDRQMVAVLNRVADALDH